MVKQDRDGLFKIGQLVEILGISADTIRYYEKIGLLSAVRRVPSGARFFSRHDLSRLQFIRRAKQANCSLGEIKVLLEMRADPKHELCSAYEMTQRKLREIERQMDELHTLRKELCLLIESDYWGVKGRGSSRNRALSHRQIQ